MEQAKSINLFNAIKSDDLFLFATLIKGNENLSFGRFPILSLCYLYGANKIIREYYSLLHKKNEYTQVFEPLEVYQKFKSVAGRCVRLYVSGSIVSPLEMLAILNKDRLLKKVYDDFVKSEKITNNIRKIYTIHKQKVGVATSYISIDKPLLTSHQKLACIKNLILSLCIIFLVSGFYLVASFSIGLGIYGVPFKISSQRQLYMALQTKETYLLKNDIFLKDFSLIENFEGVLDGNGQTIYIEYMPSDGVINNNNGEIKNLNIVYSKLEGNINKSLSLFIVNNTGKITNVSVTCDNINITCQKSKQGDIYVNGIATNNSGTIENCKTKITGKFVATGDGECSVSGLVGVNSGVIKGCVLEESSSISARDIDVSGIVSKNEYLAQVYDCKNYAQLSQETSLLEWSPNVSGIGLTNYGKIEKCVNFGKLVVNSQVNDENVQGNIFISGISTMNYGEIVKCLNKGNIKASSFRSLIYSGGITAYSYYWINENTTMIPKIYDCGSNSQIELTTDYEKAFVFAGGISGFLYGEIKNCYSISTFTNGYDENKYFIGSCLGASNVQYQLFQTVLCVSATGNCVYNGNNLFYQIGALIYGNNIVSVGVDGGNGILSKSTIEEIKQQEIYWDE